MSTSETPQQAIERHRRMITALQDRMRGMSGPRRGLARKEIRFHRREIARLERATSVDNGNSGGAQP